MVSAQRNLWQETLDRRIDCEPLRGQTEADIVVIGGGFTGLSAALHIAKLGATVCVLEAQTVGFGGSGRNVGYVNAGLWTPPDDVEALLGKLVGARLNAILANGPQTVFDLIEEHQIRCNAVRQATMHYAETPAGVRELKSRYDQQIARSAPVRLLGREEAAERTGSDRVLAALWDPRAGTIQPLAYAQGLAAAAKAAGARIFENSPVESYRREGGKWVVATPGGNVVASRLIQATNAYGVGRAGANEFIPVHYFQMATKPLPDKLLERILPGREGCWDCATVMSSFRLDREGRFMIGAVGNLEHGASSVHRSWARRKMASLFPELAGMEFEYAWSGCIAFTSDHLPKVLRIGPGAISIYGYSGRGISPGTVFGKCAAEWATSGGEAAFPVPLADAAPERFKGPMALYYEAGSVLTHLVSNRFS